MTAGTGTSRRSALKYLGAGGVAASALLTACTSVQEGQNGGRSGPFPGTPQWRFVFVNHVTTNSFFVPTRTGLADAAALLGVPEPQWTGSENGNVAQMASAMETAITGKADGIAVALTDDNAFVDLTKRALGQGIPVIAYNADAAGNYPLTYVGQDLYLSGFRMGQRIAQKVTSGDILVGISQPGGNNVQPRLDGITDALKQAAPGVRVQSVNTGAEQAGELNAMTAAYTGNTAAKGIYAVDAGSTAACAKLIADRGLTGKIGGGGFDLLDDTVTGVQAGALDFTIDQSPYLQGFLSVLYLYLFRLSGTLVAPPVTDTGLTFVTKENVSPYATAKSRFEGGDNKDVIAMPGSIPLPPASVLSR
ncbi:substrate-binding domain-containing protein [Amycolatopsis sp. FBCC-B4732]|uniref:substrate-binding domain-containing protein n=1 Tax=Amycolatopsis sp. FBCC-B4732 TaxID=3079339 RepID=UPI001FF2BABD|nr:substrate-binding domain-containing protein [Amycolatopsis sp. FBCC-B4732]UOX93036.1 substrate-binding domain-containing protein [Amycolatopsis sp. FBCC-B4732]